ncbi:MAG: flagellar hook assembly protein FlgD [Rhodobacteraceae bacterium]|jgi:flagellar basal-body rod modification protein FlgD|nr:flagellar hook assembly protein FlgD [Paracoccaceae bacterium]
MDVAPTTLTTTATTAQRSGAGGMISSDFQTFLTMLTVQMQNQDPMNPIDSADYAVQLATFSGVEQQVLTNQLLQAMQGNFGVMNMAQLAGWVGQEARVAADVQFDGSGSVRLAPNPAATADNAVLIVRDADGKLVSRETIPVSSAPYEWLGADASGNALPAGRYSLSLESSRDGEVLRTDPVEYYGRVVEVRGGSGGTAIVLEGGIEVSADAVTALRLAQPASTGS